MRRILVAEWGLWRPFLENRAWYRINRCVIYFSRIVSLNLNFKRRVWRVVELEDVIVTLVHWFSTRVWKG